MKKKGNLISLFKNNLEGTLQETKNNKINETL